MNLQDFLSGRMRRGIAPGPVDRAQSTMNSGGGVDRLDHPHVGYNTVTEEQDIASDMALGASIGVDDLLDAEAEDIEEFELGVDYDPQFVADTLGARQQRGRQMQRRLARLNRRKQQIEMRLADARSKGQNRRIANLSARLARVNAQIEQLTGARSDNAGKQAAGKQQLSKPGGRRGARGKGGHSSGGDVRVLIDPAGGTPTTIPFTPQAAPTGDWSGSVDRSGLSATIPAALVTATQVIQTNQLPQLVYTFVNIRVRFASTSALFGAQGQNLSSRGAQTYFADDSNWTDLAPWNVQTDTPLPSLRGQPVQIESPDRLRMNLQAYGASGDVGTVSVQAMVQIEKDSSAPTTHAYVNRPPYPGKYGVGR